MAPTSLPGGRALALAGLALTLGLGAGGASADVSSDRVWVELTTGGPEARLVTSRATCPPVIVDGRRVKMRLRTGRTAEFQTRVCEAPLPAGARRASVEGRRLPLPKAQPSRILIFGDSGCRLKGRTVQDCNNPRAWPFAALARLAAAHHPDLVIHLGDYWYRETPCPAGRAGCAGSPWGDNWPTWDAEFFRPAAPLLAAAPWVMARGNHEDCQRGGPGWFLLLDAAPTPPACPSASAPMEIDLGGQRLYVLDSADADDTAAPARLVAGIAGQLDALKPDLASKPGWIVTHRPIWGLAPVARVGPIGPLEVPLNATEQAAVRGRDLTGVQMIVSGHIHHFASYSFGAGRPAQLIVGTGGDIGEPGDTPKYRAGEDQIDGMTARGFAFERYGFLIMERGAAGWTGVFYDTKDRIVARCKLSGRDLACAPPGEARR